MLAEMLDTVLDKAGRSAGEAVGAGVEGVAGGYIGFMLGPWGIVVVVVIFLAIRAIRCARLGRCRGRVGLTPPSFRYGSLYGESISPHPKVRHRDYRR